MALRSSMPPLPQPSSSQWPCLMTLHKETGMLEFFDPVYNVVTTHKTGIQKLRGSRIRSSRANWLLMSHGNRGMFFFNPFSNGIIELPDLLEEHKILALLGLFRVLLTHYRIVSLLVLKPLVMSQMCTSSKLEILNGRITTP
uniref:F-box protein n=1 Tax=Solanum tuberosum TaxID=4113 RepID=M1DLR9_SOLTU